MESIKKLALCYQHGALGIHPTSRLAGLRRTGSAERYLKLNTERWTLARSFRIKFEDESRYILAFPFSFLFYSGSIPLVEYFLQKENFHTGWQEEEDHRLPPERNGVEILYLFMIYIWKVVEVEQEKSEPRPNSIRLSKDKPFYFHSPWTQESHSSG